MTSHHDLDQKSAQAVQEGVNLIGCFDQIVIEQELTFGTQPKFASKVSKVKCFLGSLEISQENSIKKLEVLGVTQEYVLTGEHSLEGVIGLHEQPYSSNHRGLFEFIPLAKVEQGQEVYHIKIHPFYQPLKGPGFMKKIFSRNAPMSAIVVCADALNMPLGNMKQGGGSPTKQHYGYSFLNIKTGPSWFGFGPGKFEKAFKHYTLEQIDDQRQQLTLTGLIAPRSK